MDSIRKSTMFDDALNAYHKALQDYDNMPEGDVFKAEALAGVRKEYLVLCEVIDDHFGVGSGLFSPIPKPTPVPKPPMPRTPEYEALQEKMKSEAFAAPSLETIYMYPDTSLANAEDMERGDAYWGLCPDCKLPGHFNMDVGRDHWMVCCLCKVRWCIGANLFSGWRDQTSEQKEANMDYLRKCREVEPEYASA